MVLYHLKLATKQEAFVSLMILSKSKADLERDFQLRLISGGNLTIQNNYEISQLMKRAESMNVTQLFTNNHTFSQNMTNINRKQKNNLKGKMKSRT